MGPSCLRILPRCSSQSSQKAFPYLHWLFRSQIGRWLASQTFGQESALQSSRGVKVKWLTFSFHLNVSLTDSFPLRFQAVQLLRKFHKFDIIVRVDGKDNFDHEFDDNSDLYRLSQAALDKLPVMKPEDEENQMNPPSNRLTYDSLALHNQSLNSQCYARPCNPLATIRTSRAVKRSFSNVSSLRPIELPQLNCCVNEGFNHSLSDERTPLKSMNQSIVQLRPNASNVSISSRASSRPESSVNVFWL